MAEKTKNALSLLELLHSLRDRQVALTRALVAIPTVNPYSGDVAPAGERAGQDWIEARMREAGAVTKRIRVPDDVYVRAAIPVAWQREWQGRENVVGEWVFGDGQGPTILLNSHMDTVGVADYELDPFSARVENGKIYGRGTSDTKASMVAGLMGIEALQQAGGRCRGRIIFESVVDEECDGGGAGTLACCLAGITGDMAIVLDGMAGAPYHGSNGVVTPHITVRVPARHSAFGGLVKALDLALIVKAAFDDFARDHQHRYPGCLANIGVFRTGHHASVMPSKAEITANIFYPFEEALAAEKEAGGFDGRRVRQRFETFIADRTADATKQRDVSVTIKWIKDLYPYRCEPDQPLFQLAGDAIEAACGKRVDIGVLSAWGDATHLARQLKIPTLGMGFSTPGQAHGNTEHIALSDMFDGAAAVALLLQRLLAV